MIGSIREPQRDLPVVAEYDVLIIGGGIGGVSAALAAAREGASTVIVEKECGLGGLATLGNIIKYLPLCDGRGHQVAAGIAEELLRVALTGVRRDHPEMGLFNIPKCWLESADSDEKKKCRYEGIFNPASFQLELEHLLQKENIDIWYDSRFCSCRTEQDKITHAIVENKSGRLALSGKMFIDASGDADLCFAAGVPVETFDYNVLCGWHYYLEDEKLFYREYTTPFSLENPEALEGPFFKGYRGKDVTLHVLESRKKIRKWWNESNQRSHCKEVHPFALASLPSFRATRRLKNSFSLKNSDVHTSFHDSIGLIGDWRERGPVYSIPLRTIRAESLMNLFVVGRCISVDTSAWDVTRTIPACAVTGQAAGTAAALVVEKQDCGCALWETSDLQERLADRGVLLDPSLVGERE